MVRTLLLCLLKTGPVCIGSCRGDGDGGGGGSGVVVVAAVGVVVVVAAALCVSYSQITKDPVASKLKHNQRSAGRVEKGERKPIGTTVCVLCCVV